MLLQWHVSHYLSAPKLQPLTRLLLHTVTLRLQCKLTLSGFEVDQLTRGMMSNVPEQTEFSD